MQVGAALRAVAPRIEGTLPSGGGALDAALQAGRLPGTRAPELLDHVEQLIGTGQAIDATRRQIGTAGANGFRTAVHVLTNDGGVTDVVEKSTAHEGAQEHFGWLVARALGIDHRVALVARAQDGSARIEHLAATQGWGSLFASGVQDTTSLESHLSASIRRESPQLTDAEVARAAKIERQLLQVFDYVIANDDRNLGNGLAHAKTGAMKLIDHGNAAVGQHGRADALVPGLRSALQGTAGRTQIDADVIAYLRRRVTTSQLAAAHDAAFAPTLRTGRDSGSTIFAASSTAKNGALRRLQSLIANDTAKTFRYDTPGSSLRAPLQAVDAQPLRGGMAQARFGERMF